MRTFLAAAVLCIFASPASARQESVTLSVPTMDCPVCPITIRKALMNVPGVREATVDFKKREARVTFDDAKARVDDLTRATREAGYPSKLASAPR